MKKYEILAKNLASSTYSNENELKKILVKLTDADIVKVERYLSDNEVSTENCDKIIAINNDKNAPIFEHSDIGIVGDLFKVLQDLINELDK